MERLALAVFDIKPLQFSLEKKKGRKKVVHHSVKMCEEGERISPLFSSEAISGFREKGDKCLSRNVGRLKLKYIYFFVLQQFQKPKWRVVFFLHSLGTGRGCFEGTCVFWEWWIQQVGWKKKSLALQRFDKACKGLRLSHYPWRSVPTCSKTLLTRLGLPTLRLTLPQCGYLYSQLLNITCISFVLTA